MSTARAPWIPLALSGIVTVLLYCGLFLNEREVMAVFTRTDGWYPFLPVIAAFAFSFAHGAFTGYFWEALGVRPRPEIQAPVGDAED
jgi:hypothetical protein